MIIFTCIFFICGDIHAKPTLTLNGGDQDYNLDRYVFVLPDLNGEYTVRDVIKKYRSGEITKQNNKNHIFLESKPQWIILPIINNTNRRGWIFDLGSLPSKRSGILDKLLIYEANQQTIFLNALNPDKKNITQVNNNRYVNVNLPPQTESLFVLYLYPTDYKHAVIPLTLRSSQAHALNEYSLEKIIIDHTPTVIIVSILIVFFGFILTSGTGFIPIIIYYLSLLILFLFAESPLIPSVIGLDIIAPMAPIIGSLLIGVACLFTVPVRYSHLPFRFLLFFFIIVSVVSIFLFTLFNVIDIDNKYDISVFISTTTLLSCIGFLLKNKSPHLIKSSCVLTAWISSVLIAQIVVFLESQQLLGHVFYYSQADKIALYFQLIMVFIGVIVSVKTEHARQLMSHVRQNQKTTSILNAKKSKESTDHSRLLRVIEREREIMEELRSRETERTEEMRNAKIVADEANQAKSAFLAVVSHEIRTPMTGIMGMVRMLRDTPLSNEQKDFVMTIGDSSEAMLALLNDILDFSKIENGSMDLENIEFDLRRVLNSVNMLMKAHSDQKNIQLLVNIQDDIPSKLYGDPTRLRQVILNLVGNALKFTSKGYVSITAKYDDTIENGDYHYIRFEVADTGLGISKEAQINLFTPFSQADNSIARKYGGTGLGLAICKTLVEAMGGEIILNSREGAGSTFSFTLPFASENKTASAPKQVKQKFTPIKNKNILVVDDNDINRKVIEGFLKKADHSCVLAENGQSALNILADNPQFDLLFLDIEMPNMSGIDLADHILGNDQLKHIPMIAVTGNVNDDDIQRYYNAGFKNHVAKPIEPEHLNKAIYDTLNNIKNESFRFSHQNEKIKITPSSKTQTKPKTVRPVVGKTLDEVMLKGLKDGLGIKKTRDLINELFIKADEIVTQFEDLKQSEDKDAARMRAHELKGMAGNFGLKVLSDKSNEIEQICKDDERSFNDIIPHIEDLSTLVERSKYAVQEFLEN